MAIDRAKARRRVKTITAWATAGAAAATAAFAFGASRGDHAAARAASPARTGTEPPASDGGPGFVPGGGYSQGDTPQADPSQGFAPPAASNAPPAATSGGS